MDKPPPFSHNLVYLSEQTSLEISEKDAGLLEEISDFNLEARYPDDKFSFYNKCTNEFTNKKMVTSKDNTISLIRKYIKQLDNNNISVQKVLLFGSYIKGMPREDSDIDIAVISSAFKGDRYSDRRLIVPYRRGIDSRIEPVPFTPDDFEKGGILIDEIKRTGQEIF